MQAEEFHDSIRPGLIAMLPRLKRFADQQVGEAPEPRPHGDEAGPNRIVAFLCLHLKVPPPHG